MIDGFKLNGVLYEFDSPVPYSQRHVASSSGDVIFSGLPEGDWEMIGIAPMPTYVEPVIQIGINGTAAAGHGVTGEAGIIIQGTQAKFYTTHGIAVGYDYSLGISMTINASPNGNFNIYSTEGWGGSINGAVSFIDFGLGQNATTIISPSLIYDFGTVGFSIGSPAGGTFQWTKTIIY